MVSLLDLVYPKYCLGCKTWGQYICSNCLQKVGRVGLVFPSGYAIWKYQGVVRQAILALKYKFASDIANELAALASKEINYLPKRAILIPIPLHPKRKRWRGFNQSEELGKRIAKLMNWQYNDKLLVRTRHNTPQAQLAKAERVRNIRGIFAVNLPSQTLSELEWANKTLIIFDDVWTTGSTLNEGVKMLQSNGGKKIIKLTICK